MVSAAVIGLNQMCLAMPDGECCCYRIESDVFGNACHLKVSAAIGLNQMCLAMPVI